MCMCNHNVNKTYSFDKISLVLYLNLFVHPSNHSVLNMIIIMHFVFDSRHQHTEHILITMCPRKNGKFEPIKQYKRLTRT